ncbi:hypothetical protein HG530_002726 [Fusarium avenaceum]|nr:hypothetical protein HG530_002726 [Fusarium avenaceum]
MGLPMFVWVSRRACSLCLPATSDGSESSDLSGLIGFGHPSLSRDRVLAFCQNPPSRESRCAVFLKPRVRGKTQTPWFVCRVAVAARLTLPSEIVDADLARLQTVEEGFEVGQAYDSAAKNTHDENLLGPGCLDLEDVLRHDDDDYDVGDDIGGGVARPKGLEVDAFIVVAVHPRNRWLALEKIDDECRSAPDADDGFADDDDPFLALLGHDAETHCAG